MLIYEEYVVHLKLEALENFQKMALVKIILNFSATDFKESVEHVFNGHFLNLKNIFSLILSEHVKHYKNIQDNMIVSQPKSRHMNVLFF